MNRIRFIMTTTLILLLLLLSTISCSEKEQVDVVMQDSTSIQLYPVQVDNKWGYIDKSGNVMIDLQYDYASNFSEGFASVRVSGKEGYINQEGMMAISPQFDRAYGFSEGLAEVRINEKWGYINFDGDIVIQTYFARTLPFTEGRAFVSEEEHGLWGVINTMGEYVVEPEFLIAHSYSGGLAVVMTHEGFKYIDTDGNIQHQLLQFSEGYLGSFSEGLASFHSQDSDRKIGFMDREGTIYVEPKYSISGSFSEGLVGVCLKDNECGYIDRTGEEIIPLQYYSTSPFVNGVALVSTGDKIILIDKSGKKVVEAPENVWMRWVVDGELIVLGEADEDKLGYMNKLGDVVWPPSK